MEVVELVWWVGRVGGFQARTERGEGLRQPAVRSRAGSQSSRMALGAEAVADWICWSSNDIPIQRLVIKPFEAGNV